MNIRYPLGWALCTVCVSHPAAVMAEQITMKVMVVNPSDTEVKEFSIRSPLPPEIKPEHVLEGDGLKVEFDSQLGAYVLTGIVTLKPKESVTKRVILEDVWMVPAQRLRDIRHEVEEISEKLKGSTYAEQGSVIALGIEHNLSTIDSSQDQPLISPQQHISRFHESSKLLQLVESDLVSLRQLMVMAALVHSTQEPMVMRQTGTAGTGHERGQLSVLTTWRLIFIVLGLLGFVSVSFFIVWQRQLKVQLAKQATTAEVDTDALERLAHSSGGSDSSGSTPPTS